LLKKLILQPEFIILLLGNAICYWYFIDHREGFGTIIWIYWCQSVIIGLFNFFDLLLIKKFSAKDFKLNDEPVTEKNKGCTAWFFLLHYGFFHFVYFFFLAIKFHAALNSKIILLAVAAFFLESLLAFRRKLAIEKEITVSLGSIFMLPYIRIIPMHLTILLPSFFNWQPAVLFILLKTLADIIFYIVVQRIYSRPVADQPKF
jgi:hypothetical protein